MKNLFTGTSILAAASLALMLLATSAGAQGLGLRADAPFAFTAGSQDFAPGQYWFDVDVERMQLAVHSTTTRATAIVHLAPGEATRATAKPDTGRLRFEKIGDRYFLVGVWRPGTYEWNNIVPSRRLVESARAAAGPDAAASYVDLR